MIDMELSGLNSPAATTATAAAAILPAVPAMAGVWQIAKFNVAASPGNEADREEVMEETNSGPSSGNENLSRMKKVQKFIADVFDITSIHGLAYLTKEGTHTIER